MEIFFKALKMKSFATKTVSILFSQTRKMGKIDTKKQKMDNHNKKINF